MGQGGYLKEHVMQGFFDAGIVLFLGLVTQVCSVYENLSGFKLKIYAFSICLSHVLCVQSLSRV